MIEKSVLLSVVSEEDMIRHLVPDFEGNIRKKNYKSIFSETDRHPSLSLYKDEDIGSWRFKSHNTGHQGDVFNLWADYYNLDCKTQFPEVLKKINDEMNLGLDGTAYSFKIDYMPLSMPFSSIFLSYWGQFGIEREILVKYDVRQVSYLSFISKGRALDFPYEKRGKIAVAYHIEDRIKLYIPAIPENFMGTSGFKAQEKAFGYKNQTKDDVFGLKQLPDGELEYVLFTAGEKDCLTANARNFNSISLQSESQLPPENLLQKLSGKTKNLLCCYDNDESGMLAAGRLEKKFGFLPIRIPQDFKDITEYFLKNTREDFKRLIEETVNSNKSRPRGTEAIGKKESMPTLHKSIEEKNSKQSNETSALPPENTRKEEGNKKKKTLLHMVEDYLTSKYEFRFNTIALSVEKRRKEETGENWSVVNDSEIWRELHKENIKITTHNVQSLLKSEFVKDYNPLQSYFLQFGSNGYKTDFIRQLSEIVILENDTDDEKENWKNHLEKWMIRAIRAVFEPHAMNKHAIILVSQEEGIGKSFFCEFLCPKSLSEYYTSNPIISHEKDSQMSLATSFIINLDELQQFKANIHRIKSWISQTSVRLRLPYDKKETTRARICSFVGSSNEDDFLHSELGYSRWLCFKIKGTHTIEEETQVLLENAWGLAYKLYKENPKRGELLREDHLELRERNKVFKLQSSEYEIVNRYISSTQQGSGTFMTTTDILQYIQERIGNTLRLNKILLGRAIKEYGFERSVYNSIYGYWVNRH
jgi:predicted P-loop ATPase